MDLDRRLERVTVKLHIEPHLLFLRSNANANAAWTAASAASEAMNSPGTFQGISPDWGGYFDEITSLAKATPTHSLETGGWFILVIFGTVAITSLLPHIRVVEVKGLVSGSSKVVRMLTRIFLRRAQSVGHHLLLLWRFKGGLFTQSPKWPIQYADPVWLALGFISVNDDWFYGGQRVLVPDLQRSC